MNEKTDQTKSAAENWFQPLKKFFSLPLNSRWTTVLIWLLALFVLGLNIFVAWLYWTSDKFINYFSSDTFKALLASVLIPLLMSSISRAFKIGEKLEVDREKVAHEIRERRFQAIKDTNGMWRDLYNLSTDVAYFQTDHSKISPRELRKKLEQFADSAEEVVNLWARIFDEIPSKDLEMVLFGLNLLLLSVSTVIDAIETNDKEAADLQNGLLIIQDGVRFALHHRIMMVFNLSMDGKPEDMKKVLAEIRNWGEFFRDQLNIEPNLPPGTVADVFIAKRKKFVDKYLQYLKSQKEMPEAQREKPTFYAQEESEYYQTIYTIPFDQLGFSRRRLFSNAKIKTLAAEMFYQNDRSKILSNA